MRYLDKCILLDIREAHDARGKLSFIEEIRDIPFQIKRVYYLHSLEKGTVRGGHAHRRLEQVLIAMNGAFSLSLYDGATSKEIVLDSPSVGLYICPMIWRDVKVLENSSVLTCLASDIYTEEEYIRDIKDFEEMSARS